MPDKIITYKVGGSVIDVPIEKKDIFLSKYKDATEMKSFIVGSDTIDVPLDKVEILKSKYPHAKPTFGDIEKKKNIPSSLESDFQESIPSEGIGTPLKQEQNTSKESVLETPSILTGNKTVEEKPNYSWAEPQREPVYVGDTKQQTKAPAINIGEESTKMAPTNEVTKNAILSPSEIRADGKDPSWIDYANYGAKLLLEVPSGDFFNQGTEEIVAGAKKAHEGLKMAGIITPSPEEMDRFIKEDPNNLQLRGFLRALNGTAGAAFSAFMHFTPTGAAIAQGAKAVEAIPMGDKVTGMLFAPLTTLYHMPGVGVPEAPGMEPSTTEKEFLGLGDIVASSVLLKGAHDTKGIIADKIKQGVELTPDEMNEAIRSSIEVAKDPIAVQEVGDMSGVTPKTSAELEKQTIPVVGTVPLQELSELANKVKAGETRFTPEEIALKNEYPNEFASEMEKPSEQVQKIDNKIVDAEKKADEILGEKKADESLYSEVKTEPTVQIEAKETIPYVAPEFQYKQGDIPVAKRKAVDEVFEKEHIDFANEMIDSGLFNSVGQILELRPQFGLSTADVHKGISDIKKNKNSAPARKVIEATAKVLETGEIPLIQGTGGVMKHSGLTLEDWRNETKKNAVPTELNEEHVVMANKLPPNLVEVISRDGITKDNFDTWVKDVEWIFEPEEIKQIKDYLNETTEPTRRSDVETTSTETEGETLGGTQEEIKGEDQIIPPSKNKSTTDIGSDELLEGDRDFNIGNTNPDNAIGIINSSPDFSFVSDIPKSLKKFWQKYFKKEGDLPLSVFERDVLRKGEAAALTHEMTRNSQELKTAIRDAYKGKLKAAQIIDINKGLSGEKPIHEFPEPIANVISKMRSHIDKLSKMLIDDGIVEGDLAAKIQNNLGTYLYRSYRIHDIPDWASNVPFEVVNRAKNFIRKSFEDKGQKISEEDLGGVMQELLHKFDEDTPLKILSGGKLGSKDLSILKKRGDIAPEIRALWGEYNDPLVNYAKSVVKASGLIANAKFLKDVKNIGLDNFLFDKPTDTHYAQIAGEGTKAMNPLNGLYTTPEIKAAFESFNKNEPLPNWLALWMKANGFAKYSKTILSIPITHVRNFVSNPLILVRNGNVSLGKVPIAAKTVFNELANGSNELLKEKYKEYLKLGIAGEGINIGELKAHIKDANKNMDSFESLSDNIINRVAKKGTRLAERLYDFEDTIFKIYSFETEKAKYKDAFPDMTESELNKKAAEVVRLTTPTYSEVPMAIQKLRRFPITGTFVSFPYEIIRTTINNAVLGFEELKDPKTRMIGAKRIAGTMVALGGVSAISSFTKSINNVSSKDDDDMRRFVAPWMKNTEMAYIKNDGNGQYKVLDLGNTDPHNYLKKPFIALLNGGDPKNATVDAMKEFFRPFFSEEMLLSKALDVSRNKTEDGREVYNEQSPVGTQVADIYAHFAKALEPGGVSGMKKIVKGALGSIDPKTGLPFDYKTELINQFTGQKISTVNVPQSFQFKLSKLEKDLTEAKSIYNKVKYSKVATDAQKKEAYDMANSATHNLIKMASEDFNAAVRLGVPLKELIKILKGARLSKKQIISIKKGLEYDLKTE